MRYPDLLSQPSRFARWPAWTAALVLLAFALLIGVGITRTPLPEAMTAPPPVEAIVGNDAPSNPAGKDVGLYRTMAEKVAQGENYYSATAKLLRDNDYPLRPFVTMRLPTLTYILAMLTPDFAIISMSLLLAAVIILWTIRLAPALRTPEICPYASLFIMMNCLTGFAPDLIYFHEGWAALLIALSLATHQRERWWPSVLLALCSVMIRELALPFLLLMGGFALLERRWREAAGWAAAIIAFFIVLGLHAQAVWAVTTATDPASPGWSMGGGWTFVVGSVQKSTLFNHIPVQVMPLLVPLALLGWSAWDNPTGMRSAAYLGGFACGMMLFGRPDNFYWAVMITPILFIGLLFAPAALRDLARAVARPLAMADQRAT